jgi:hypothetical protein
LGKLGEQNQLIFEQLSSYASAARNRLCNDDRQAFNAYTLEDKRVCGLMEEVNGYIADYTLRGCSHYS